MAKGQPKRTKPESRADASARAVAVQHLLRIEEEGAYVGLVGGDVDEAHDAREERQATEYVAGVTRWRRWLDFVLARFYRGDFATIEPVLRQILRIGAYDVLFLYTPDHAAVNEAVALAKRMVRPGAGGLVNAILRALLRNRQQLPEPSTGDLADDLAIRHSHPTWMVRRWLSRYGPEQAAALLRWNNTPPHHALRVNTLRTTPEAVRAQLAELGVEAVPLRLPYVLRVERLQPVLRSGLLASGTVAVQDESAALVVRLLDPQPGETVLDACAAPGGKTLHAAQLMQNQGRLRALDLHENRLSPLRRAAEAHGATIVDACAGDLRTFSADRLADRVLVDAPCSGLGVLSKRADLRWRRGEASIPELAALQGELLAAAARHVRPGGLLVYSTCTIEPEENERVVERFLAAHPAFAREPAPPAIPADLVTPEGYYATFPPRDGMDGAFGARLRFQGYP